MTPTTAAHRTLCQIKYPMKIDCKRRRLVEHMYLSKAQAKEDVNLKRKNPSVMDQNESSVQATDLLSLIKKKFILYAEVMDLI